MDKDNDDEEEEEEDVDVDACLQQQVEGFGLREQVPSKTTRPPHQLRLRMILESLHKTCLCSRFQDVQFRGIPSGNEVAISVVVQLWKWPRIIV